MNHNVKRLFDIEIDEVSVVDRPANQHGLIAFAKNDSSNELETGVPEELFDETGEEIPVEVLEHGDIVFDAEGNEFVYVEDDEDDDIEKAIALEAGNIGERLASRGGKRVEQVKDFFAPKTGARKWLPGQVGPGGQQAYTDARQLNKKRVGIAGATTALGVGGTGYALSKAEMSDHMSLGDSVLEELSKAVTERDREFIIAKAMDEVEIAKAQAAEAFEYAAALEDARVEEAFISKAAEYNLPVAPEVFGPILKSIAEALTEDELELLDELFSAIGDSLYDEIGYVGESSNTSVLDTVSGLASEFVGKSDVSYEQAYSAMFEANPSAYDAYLTEGR
jgi:hypothetical protein